MTGTFEGFGLILHDREEDPMTETKPVVQAPDYFPFSNP